MHIFLIPLYILLSSTFTSWGPSLHPSLGPGFGPLQRTCTLFVLCLSVLVLNPWVLFRGPGLFLSCVSPFWCSTHVPRTYSRFDSVLLCLVGDNWCDTSHLAIVTWGRRRPPPGPRVPLVESRRSTFLDFGSHLVQNSFWKTVFTGMGFVSH